MRKSRVCLATAVCLPVLFLAPSLKGQATSSISGTVTDATGSVLAGAKVTVAAEAIGLTRDVTTDASGHYVVPLLPLGNYVVRAALQGFQNTESRDIRLQVDEQREIDFKLALSSVQQNVEVVANVVAIETVNRLSAR